MSQTSWISAYLRSSSGSRALRTARPIGADAQYHNGDFNVFGLIDYDASYNVINNAMLVGNWRVSDRLTLHGRYQGGAGPFLMTRNAIIGQPVNTVAALLETYTEGQVRTLARNRTAQVRSGSAGVSTQLSPRWHLTADVTYDEYGSTVSSGGVAAFPASGPQYVYSGQLLGSSLFKAGDTVLFELRHLQSRDRDANTAIFDWRLPRGDRLRINPRLAITRQNKTRNAAGVTEQWIANPMLRLLYSWRRDLADRVRDRRPLLGPGLAARFAEPSQPHRLARKQGLLPANGLLDGFPMKTESLRFTLLVVTATLAATVLSACASNTQLTSRLDRNGLTVSRWTNPSCWRARSASSRQRRATMLTSGQWK